MRVIVGSETRSERANSPSVILPPKVRTESAERRADVNPKTSSS